MKVHQHSLADTRNGQHFLGLADDVPDLFGVILDGLCGIAVGTNAERILAVDFEEIGGLVKDGSDGFIVHRLKINTNRVRRQSSHTAQARTLLVEDQLE